MVSQFLAEREKERERETSRIACGTHDAATARVHPETGIKMRSFACLSSSVDSILMQSRDPIRMIPCSRDDLSGIRWRICLPQLLVTRATVLIPVCGLHRKALDQPPLCLRFPRCIVSHASLSSCCPLTVASLVREQAGRVSLRLINYLSSS